MDRSVVVLPAKPVVKKKFKVAAYCRVSMEDAGMLHSLNAQVSHYKKYIAEHKDWEFAGVYNEKPMTGTKAERPEFQRLISDCRNGKIDMIITKAISRFARSTITTLDYTRELKELGVAVYFEEQNINTLSAEGELVLTLLAAFAQAEAESVSENVKWRLHKEFEKGNDPTLRFMFGFNVSAGEVSINEAEASIVRGMFEAYANGVSAKNIAKRLEEQGVPTPRGGAWTDKKVRLMLRNERYKGDALLQKRYVNNYRDKQLILNKGVKTQYYSEDCHPAIVSRELFDKVQDIMDSNRFDGYKPYQDLPKYPLTGKVRCGICGKNYKRRTNKYGDKWMCTTFAEKGKAVCPSKQIPEDTLINAICEVLGIVAFDEDVFKSKIAHITTNPNNLLTFHFLDGKEIEYVWKDRSRSSSWTPEMREAARQKALRGKNNG